MQALRKRLFGYWSGFLEIRKPVIAAVDGACLGAGLELAMACDIVYASTTSTFALPEIKYGLMPGCGGTQRLTRRVGKARAMEMILLGETCAFCSPHPADGCYIYIYIYALYIYMVCMLYIYIYGIYAIYMVAIYIAIYMFSACC